MAISLGIYPTFSDKPIWFLCKKYVFLTFKKTRSTIEWSWNKHEMLRVSGSISHFYGAFFFFWGLGVAVQRTTQCGFQHLDQRWYSLHEQRGPDGSMTGFCFVGDSADFPNRKSTRTGESMKWICFIFGGPRISKSKNLVASFFGGSGDRWVAYMGTPW